MSAFTPIERLFDPANDILTPATAARLLGMRPTEDETARLDYSGSLGKWGVRCEV